MAASTLSLLSYLRIPIAATSAIAASLSGLLYWKQKYMRLRHHGKPIICLQFVPQ